jgi:nucleoside-diphosphate-sugar epimerase
MSFNPGQLAQAIRAVLPDFSISYLPDSRQAIAATWPHSVDDSCAMRDWGWQAQVDIEALVADMLEHVDAVALS